MNDTHRQFLRALAIFLIALAAAGCATQQVAQTPRNVIIMYADGVAATQLEFGRYSSQALRNQPYAITDTVLKQGTIGLLTTHPYEAFATDSAATASAMSTGVKTTIDAIGVGPDGKPVRTAAQAAKAGGKATGRTFSVETVPIEALQAQLGATDPLQATFAALTYAYTKGDVIEGARETAARHGIELRSVAQLVSEMVA